MTQTETKEETQTEIKEVTQTETEEVTQTGKKMESKKEVIRKGKRKKFSFYEIYYK